MRTEQQKLADRKSLYQWLIAGVLGVIVLAWLVLPAPYNPSYLVKRAIFTPTAECRDGIYSFSNNRSGTCSNHGGVRKWIAKNSS